VHVHRRAVDPESRSEPPILSEIRIVLDQMGGRAHEGDFAGLSAGDDGGHGRRLLADAGVPLVVERPLQ
jgi:hypothetical protein